MSRRSRRLSPLILVAVVLIVSAGCKRSVPVPAPRPVATFQPTAVDTQPTLPPTPTSIPSPSPPYGGTYAGTPTPDPTPVGRAIRSTVESHVVQAGQNLFRIAAMFGCTVEEIVAANGLADADSISIGQTLIIPVSTSRTGPALKLVPDSELVYGPAYIHFDLATFVAEHGGYLVKYSDEVEGEWLGGSEIIQLVSERFGVGPRVLLALLELQSGWVTRPLPASGTLAYPLGYVQAYYEGLYRQLSWAAVRLNEGYYGWKWGDRPTMLLSDGTRAAVALELNPGTAGVQNCLAGLSGTWGEWMQLTGSGGFLATYEHLFGNPFTYSVDPLVPPDLAQPELELPWEDGITWYLTSGPHGGYGIAGGLAALDFAPSEENLGCMPSADWVVVAAPGLVVRSENGSVVVDLDGDGFEQSGWVLLYHHIYAEGRVDVGTHLERGQRIGRPSCEGGVADATHLHLARRYNGEWIPAGRGPTPMVLSGWTAHDGTAPYEGTMTRLKEVRTAAERWDDDTNGLAK